MSDSTYPVDQTLDFVPQSPPPPKSFSDSGSHGGTSGKLAVEFDGNASEYFGIWIVNLLLTIVTLGIWSAWAKVRRMQYFYGNTRLGADNFEFLASGWQIFRGRIIAIVLLVVLFASQYISAWAQLIATLIFIPLFPWIVNLSLLVSAVSRRNDNVAEHSIFFCRKLLGCLRRFCRHAGSRHIIFRPLTSLGWTNGGENMSLRIAVMAQPNLRRTPTSGNSTLLFS